MTEASLEAAERGKVHRLGLLSGGYHLPPCVPSSRYVQAGNMTGFTSSLKGMNFLRWREAGITDPQGIGVSERGG